MSEMNALHIIKKHVVTEKSSAAQERFCYTFEVSKQANKLKVKQIFFEMYGVKPKKVNIINRSPKVTLRRGMKRRSKKFALVYLDSDIDLLTVK